MHVSPRECFDIKFALLTQSRIGSHRDVANTRGEVAKELSETEEKLLKMGIAGVACAGTSTFLNPVDVTKIKMQVEEGRTPIAEMRAIVENGPARAHKGIEPSCQP